MKARKMADDKWQMGKFVLLGAILLLPWAMPFRVQADDAAILRQLQLLNQIPEEQMNEKTDPCFSIMRSLYDQDGPDFLNLRALLSKPSVRTPLNPSARCVLANIVSQRWDTFSLSGTLYLSGIRSKNPELREKARKKLVCFIQPSQIPELIQTLKYPGPNVLAFDVLQEVTGEHLDPSVKTWQKWWQTTGKKSDIVGHLLNSTRNQLSQTAVHPFDQERFWYAPDGVGDVQSSKRSEREQTKIDEWRAWVNGDVKKYVDDWAILKPILDRITHQPDPRVNKYLESLTANAGYGDYASIVLAWRSSAASLPLIQSSWKSMPTVGRTLARGSLGDKTALTDLLEIMEKHQSQPMSYKIMGDDGRNLLTPLRTVGVISAEQAFRLLCHQNFDFDAATTPREKKAVYKAAKSWLHSNIDRLTLDRRRGYFALPGEK